MDLEAEPNSTQADVTQNGRRGTSMNASRDYGEVARKVARINGRLLLYAMTPLLLLGPILAKDGQPWHFLVSIPLAIGNVVLSCWFIDWGSSLQGGHCVVEALRDSQFNMFLRPTGESAKRAAATGRDFP